MRIFILVKIMFSILKKKFLFLIFSLVFILPSHSNIVEELTILNNLYKEGAINKEEFSKAKSLILKSNNEMIESKSLKVNKKKENKKKKIEKNKNIQKSNSDEDIDDFDLSNTYVSFNEFKELGTYQKIETYPEGLFKVKGSSKKNAEISMMKMYETFVQKPKLLEKYPENMMKAMAYFEIFYNYQLKENEKSLENFEKNYPNINWRTKKEVKTLYSLNNAKKSMREALSLNQENTINEALDRYVFMHNFLEPSEKITNKLTSFEKKLKNENLKLKKYYGNFKKILSDKSENRINDKDFKKNLNKNKKNLKKSFTKITNINKETDKLYKSMYDIYMKSIDYLDECSPSCKSKNYDLIIDVTTVNLSILKEFEPQIIKKKYSQNMKSLSLDALAEEDQATLALITSKLKIKKKK